MKTDQRFGFIALAGATNAGKSTLLNHCVGSKVSIVTHKVQTTRAQVRGIVIVDNAQLVFVDTPGIFDPRTRLQRAMISAAWRGIEDADVVVFMFDAHRSKVDETTRKTLQQIAKLKKPAFLILNKVDLVRREKLLQLSEELNGLMNFEKTFMLSALTGDGVDDFLKALAQRVPKEPWMYPEDQLSDLPTRLLAAEITREKLFLQLHQELPYGLAVATDSWETFSDGSVKIQQTIFVERQAHKRILIGSQGKTIKSIRLSAQKDIAEAIGAPVHLFLFVKVRERWMEDPERYKEWGLDYNV